MTENTLKIKNDSGLRSTCSYVLNKAIEAYLNASIVIDNNDSKKPILICRFKVVTLTTNRELILIRKSHGICYIIESIIDAITERYEEAYDLHAYMAILINDVLNSGEVNYLLTSPTVKALKERHPAFPAYWFQHNIETNNASDPTVEFKSRVSEYRFSNGYRNRIEFLKYCLEHLKNETNDKARIHKNSFT